MFCKVIVSSYCYSGFENAYLNHIASARLLVGINISFLPKKGAKEKEKVWVEVCRPWAGEALSRTRTPSHTHTPASWLTIPLVFCAHEWHLCSFFISGAPPWDTLDFSQDSMIQGEEKCKVMGQLREPGENSLRMGCPGVNPALLPSFIGGTVTTLCPRKQKQIEAGRGTPRAFQCHGILICVSLYTYKSSVTSELSYFLHP